MGYTPHVLVVGGGATGTGIARDLAMRGLEVTLVDRGHLASGTSGSMHALLHSGARYAVDDRETAATCHRENRILRRIAGHLVRETGGLFASLPDDPDGFLEEKQAACEAAGIETEVLSARVSREREPALAESVDRALAVPDAVVNPFLLCVANARAAVRLGATVKTSMRVVDVTVADDAVDTVVLRNDDPDVDWLSASKTEHLDPDYVVNATGPWAGEVAELAGLSVPMRHSQGAMLVTERGGLDTVVNRCRPRTQGDIAVPFGATTVLGTTDRPVDDPTSVERDVAEVDFLVDELGALVPDVAAGRPYRAYWGVRALPVDGSGATTEDTVDGASVDDGATEKASRSYTLVDHEARDGVWGLTTVFGGKLTIHRYVAERVSDHVCAKFGIDRPCRTAEIELPPSLIEDGPARESVDDPPLCPCADVTYSRIRAARFDEDVPTGPALRPVVRRTGAAMAGCQGGRCAHRLASSLYPTVDADRVEDELDGLAADRWAGARFALWDEGFATAAQTYELHAGTLNRVGLPGPGEDRIRFAAFDPGPAGDVPSPDASNDGDESSDVAATTETATGDGPGESEPEEGGVEDG